MSCADDVDMRDEWMNDSAALSTPELSSEGDGRGGVVGEGLTSR